MRLEDLSPELRRLAGDLDAVARRAGLPVETVRQVVDGTIRPSPQIRSRLARALDAEEGL